MKKKNLIQKLIAFSLMFSAIFLCGCASGVTPVELVSDIAEFEFNVNDLGADFADISVEDIKDAPALDEITQKQLAEADIKQIKAIVAKNYGNGFRYTFGIPEDKTMLDSDWENIRGFMYFTKFNTFVYVDENGNSKIIMDTTEEMGMAKEAIGDTRTEEEILEDTRKEVTNHIMGMEKKEFLDTLFSATAPNLDLNNEEKIVYRESLDALSDEQIDELREELIEILVIIEIETAKEKTE